MIANQVYIFLETILTGAIIGILFDFFRTLRRKGKIKNILVFIQDLIFWLIIGIIIIMTTFFLNNGDLRGYMLIGYVFGIIFYMILFSKYVKNIFNYIMNFIDIIFSKIRKKLVGIFNKAKKT